MKIRKRTIKLFEKFYQHKYVRGQDIDAFHREHNDLAHVAVDSIKNDFTDVFGPKEDEYDDPYGREYRQAEHLLYFVYEIYESEVLDGAISFLEYVQTNYAAAT